MRVGKRIAAAFFAACLLAASLSGCGGGTAVTGGDSVKKHLGALGFVPGVVVSVVQVMDGSMILGVQESRIAVNEDLARRIMVEAA